MSELMGSCLSQIQALLPAAFDVAMLVSRELRRADGSASVSPASHQLGLVSAYKNYSKSGEPAFTNFKANFRGVCHESCLPSSAHPSPPSPAKRTGTAMYMSISPTRLPGLYLLYPSPEVLVNCSRRERHGFVRSSSSSPDCGDCKLARRSSKRGISQ